MLKSVVPYATQCRYSWQAFMHNSTFNFNCTYMNKHDNCMTPKYIIKVLVNLRGNGRLLDVL